MGRWTLMDVFAEPYVDGVVLLRYISIDVIETSVTYLDVDLTLKY